MADGNAGSAIDLATGLAFNARLVAPSDYAVITPITTLVSAMTLEGVSRSNAEEIVLNALGLSANIDLANFDPFSEDGSTELLQDRVCKGR